MPPEQETGATEGQPKKQGFDHPAMEKYASGLLHHQTTTLDEALKAASEACEEALMPAWSATPGQGRFFQLQCRMLGVENVLEVGTFGGHGTIWCAAAHDNLQVTTIEHNSTFAQVARANFRKAGIHDRVELIQQSGRDAMIELTEQVRNEQRPSYGLVLLDLEDTSRTWELIDMAIGLCSPRACILVHCALRLSDLAKETPNEPNVRAKASREILRNVGNDSRIDGGLFMCSGERDYDLLYITLTK
jgi:predicted O-methyltransferase YrrM